MSKISYKDKAPIAETGFWIPNNCCKISRKGLKTLLSESNQSTGWWAWVSNGTKARYWQVAIGRKQHEQRKMLDILNC